jgi:IPT/TIG domain-containing protein/beta-propeller repeat-containing protein
MNCVQTGSKTIFTFCKLLILMVVLVASIGIAQSKNPKKKAIPLHPASMSTSETVRGNPIPSYGALPLSFEANQGQADAAVNYISHGDGYALFLTGTGAVMALQGKVGGEGPLQKLDAKTRNKWENRKIGRRLARLNKSQANHVLRLGLDGAKVDAFLEPLDELPGKSNYFIGKDPSKWRSGVPNYARVRDVGVYPGVDLIYYGNQRQLEFDFVISPGADPKAIALRFGSGERLSVTRHGSLRIGSSPDFIVLHRPSIYQVTKGKKHSVSGGFTLLADGRVGFRVGVYNHSEPLIIDPVLSYSTFLSGNSGASADGIAVDSSGNAYIAGSTISTDFPMENAYQSGGITNSVAFLSKFDPTGTTLLYSTYLGGTGESYSMGVAIDGSGNAYVTGYTFTSAFPIVNGLQTANNNVTGGNAFVARIDTTQVGISSLVYSTYLGGGGNASSWGDAGYGIATDQRGRAYVTGQTTSDASIVPFPTTVSAYQSSSTSSNGTAFLSVIDTNLTGATSLIYSTYLGGDGAGPYGEFGTGITIDANGNAYLVGQTTSDAAGPFPTTPGAFQTSLKSPNGNAFVAEITPNASGSQSLLYSTYLGGSTTNPLGDYASAIALDPAGKVYIVGDTSSQDFPVTSGVFQTTNSAVGRAFLAKLDLSQPGTQALVYATFLGGTNGDYAWGVTVNGSGNSFVVGQTASSDFPTTSDALQSASKNSFWTGFVSELSTDATSLLYSTYLGGTIGDVASTVALDQLGNVYIAGYTDSSDFPTANAFQSTLQSTEGGFVTKFSGLSTSIVSIQLTPQNPTVSLGATAKFAAIGTLNNGSTEDLSSSAIWGTSNPSVVRVPNLPQSQGFAVGASIGNANLTATLGTLTASTNLTVVPAPSAPSIATVSPTSGLAASQVTITGSGFGVTQGQGYLWLGTTVGLISNWSDTQIVAAVASGSTTGTVWVTQGGLQSNIINFTIAAPGVASVTPASAPQGATVTIVGSGFGAAQGNGLVWLGTAYGIVNSWSDTQVVATVASGSLSGTAGVLRGGWSNSVPFVVLGGPPRITNISPSSGTPATTVTITGSGFGASQAGGIAWIGGTTASVLSWTDTQITVSVSANAVTGVAKIQQNGIWSNTTAFTVPSTGGPNNQLALVPSVISMVVGNNRSIQALYVTTSQPATGLTWTSSDVSIVTLSSDNPPVLTAISPGNVTISAGGASADVTVYSGQAVPGTIQWSKNGDGSGIAQILPAVPSDSGVDTFALQSSGSVEAVRGDGTVAWNASVGAQSTLTADFLGGLIVQTQNALIRLDPITGQQVFAYTFTGLGQCCSLYEGKHPVAVHTDGTIFVVDGSSVVGLDPVNGSQKFNVPLDYSSSSVTSTCPSENRYTSSQPPTVGSLIIAGDGYLYFPYQYSDSSVSVSPSCDSQENDGSHLRLIRIGTDGSKQKTVMGDWTGYRNYTHIDDGQGGAITLQSQFPAETSNQL